MADGWKGETDLVPAGIHCAMESGAGGGSDFGAHCATELTAVWPCAPVRS